MQWIPQDSALAADCTMAPKQLGRGTASGLTQGSPIDERDVVKVDDPIANAQSLGASAIASGARNELDVTLFMPTVMTGVTLAMKVAREARFPPLAPLIRFDPADEVLAIASDTKFGHAVSFYARDLRRAWRVSEAIEASIVGVNSGLIVTEMAPFGDVKQSDIGRESAQSGFEDDLEVNDVCLAGL